RRQAELCADRIGVKCHSSRRPQEGAAQSFLTSFEYSEQRRMVLRSVSVPAKPEFCAEGSSPMRSYWACTSISTLLLFATSAYAVTITVDENGKGSIDETA